MLQHGLVRPRHDLAEIQRAIEGEASAIQDYSKLLCMAPSDEDRENLRAIIADETKHFLSFRALYWRLTGVCPPPVVARPPAFAGYAEGLRESFYDELHDARFYRSIMLSTCDPGVACVFYEASTDEMMHATRFSRLLCLVEEAENTERRH
ncbi:MAG: ferritin-like domain-containing protein [Firmicutes bacterium]|jgi:rubrerythrin|nr:ferritin-like domain-containing protein [Bacillota bacterium]